MLREAIADPDLDPPMHGELYEKKHLQMAEHINEFVDIFCGRSTKKGIFEANWTPANADGMSRKLLTILAWFLDWKASTLSDGKIARGIFCQARYVCILQHH